MYVSRQHHIDDAEALDLARGVGVGELITHGEYGLNATRLPFVIRCADDRTILETHVARVNPQWRDTGEALIIVNVTDEHIPGHFLPPEPDGARMPYVPTWNYVTVHLRGTLTTHEDSEWIGRHMADMVAHHESQWRAETHSHRSRVERSFGALVGLSVTLDSITGKAKLHQNMSSADIAHIADHVAPINPQIAGQMRDRAIAWAHERESRVHHALRARHARDEGSY